MDKAVISVKSGLDSKKILVYTTEFFTYSEDGWDHHFRVVLHPEDLFGFKPDKITVHEGFTDEQILKQIEIMEKTIAND